MTQNKAASIYRRRWYDQNTRYAESVLVLEKSPPQLQSIIADGIIMLAEREFAVSRLMHAVKSLGHEKVLALHKSQNRRRVLDKNPRIHRAMNYLYILTEENRAFMATKISQMNQLVIDYLQACHQTHRSPQTDDIEEMLHLFIENNLPEAQAFLDALKHRLYQEIQKIVTPSTGMDEDRSMRIHGDDIS